MKNCKLLALACLIWAAMPVKADLAPTVMLHRGGESENLYVQSGAECCG